jgi:hypothetical protein
MSRHPRARSGQGPTTPRRRWRGRQCLGGGSSGERQWGGTPLNERYHGRWIVGGLGGNRRGLVVFVNEGATSAGVQQNEKDTWGGVRAGGGRVCVSVHTRCRVSRGEAKAGGALSHSGAGLCDHCPSTGEREGERGARTPLAGWREQVQVSLGGRLPQDSQGTAVTVATQEPANDRTSSL